MDNPVSCPLPYKFNHSWMPNVDFVKMVRVEWPLLTPEAPVDGMEDLSFKLRLLKRKVKDWTREKTLEMREKSFHIEEEIKSLLNSSTLGLLCSWNNTRLLALRLELQRWMDHELQSTRMQIILTWASQGDANTKFFHAVASTRKNHNDIWGLEDEGGNLIDDEIGIMDLAVRYFKQIFEDDHLTNIEAQLKVICLFPSFINPEERETFTFQISLEEVELALKSFKKDKSPSLDEPGLQDDF